MAKKRGKTTQKKELAPVLQIAVVFVIVAAMFLLMYAARLNP